MDLHLPPAIKVRQFLRVQRDRKATYREWSEAAFANKWKSGCLRGAALRDFAREYHGQLAAVGARDIESDGVPDIVLIKTSRAYSSRGTVLWPVGLASQNAKLASSYTEEALMLVRTGMLFHPAKVIVHEAPYWVCLTRHFLERLVERRGAEGELLADLPRIGSALLDRTGLALAHGLAMEVDEGEWSRTTFVPYSDGLIVLTNRLVAGPTYAKDLGFKFNFVKRRYSDTYIKRGLLAPAEDAPPGGVCVSAWVATTYLAPEQLSAAQKAYVNWFDEWAGRKAAHESRLAVQIQFDPDFTFNPVRHHPHADGDDERLLRRLRQSLVAGAFKPHRREPVSYLVEPDMDSRAYRAELHKRRSA